MVMRVWVDFSGKRLRGVCCLQLEMVRINVRGCPRSAVLLVRFPCMAGCRQLTMPQVFWTPKAALSCVAAADQAESRWSLFDPCLSSCQANDGRAQVVVKVLAD